MQQKTYTGDYGFIVRCEGYHIVRFINEKGKVFYPESDGKGGYIAEEGVTDGSFFEIHVCANGKRYIISHPLYKWN